MNFHEDKKLQKENFRNETLHCSILWQNRKRKILEQKWGDIGRRAVCLEEMTCAAEEEMIFLSPCEILPGTNTTVISSFFFLFLHAAPLPLFSPYLHLLSSPSTARLSRRECSQSITGRGWANRRGTGVRVTESECAPVCLYSSTFFPHLIHCDTEDVCRYTSSPGLYWQVVGPQNIELLQHSTKSLPPSHYDLLVATNWWHVVLFT